LQGDTKISAIADADGKVISAEIAQSSGWRILDDAVLQAVQNCKVLDQPDMEKTPLKGTFKWRISGIDYQQPQLIAASCCLRCGAYCL
jgi:TonB family protein